MHLAGMFKLRFHETDQSGCLRRGWRRNETHDILLQPLRNNVPIQVCRVKAVLLCNENLVSSVKTS
jgi:hypothetical protein